jgi:excisionase family DNA binding protein
MPGYRGKMQTLTPDEAADILKLDRKTVENMLRSGRMPGTKISNRWRILEDDLLAFIKGEWEPKPKPGPKPATKGRTRAKVAPKKGSRR